MMVGTKMDMFYPDERSEKEYQKAKRASDQIAQKQREKATA